MTIEHILNRIDRIAHIIALDAKQKSTIEYAKSIQALTELARKGIDSDGHNNAHIDQETGERGPWARDTVLSTRSVVEKG